MPAAGSVMGQVESSTFYAEDDRISVPRVIQQEAEPRTVSNVITNNTRTPTTISQVQLFSIW